MTTPVIPTTTASQHPRFSGGERPTELDAPATRKIDTEAARERVAASRTAAKASDKPPLKRAAKDKPAPAPVPEYRAGMYKVPVAALYGQVGQVVSYVAYPIGQALIGQAGPCAEAWDNLARTNPKVRKWLGNMTKTGAWGELIAAHIPIMMTTMYVLGPASFRERMGDMVMSSMDATAETVG